MNYENPKIAVGSVAVRAGEVLPGRRSTEPREGFWRLSAGSLKLGETVEAGAAREARKEARTRLEIDRVLAVYSVPRVSQVQIMFRARLTSPEIAVGAESTEVGLFALDDIPCPDIAFPTVGWTLRHYHESKDREDFPLYSNPLEGL